jgi:LacI family transcriptional regulator
VALSLVEIGERAVTLALDDSATASHAHEFVPGHVILRDSSNLRQA